jgi:hypothetical protein
MVTHLFLVLEEVYQAIILNDIRYYITVPEWLSGFTLLFFFFVNLMLVCVHHFLLMSKNYTLQMINLQVIQKKMLSYHGFILK